MASLNNITFRDVQSNFDSVRVEKALKLWQDGQVEDCGMDEEGVLSGLVVDGRRPYTASVSLIDDTLNMMCECGGLRGGPCVHVLAVLIGWIGEEGEDIDLESVDSKTLSGSPSSAKVNPPILFPEVGPQEIRADWRRRLENLTVKDLRDIASARGIKLKGTLRDQVLDGLVEAVSDPAALPAALERLQSDARRLFDLFCAVRGTVPNFSMTLIAPYLEAALANHDRVRPVDECRADLARLGLYSPPTTVNYYPIPLQAMSVPLPNPQLFRPFEGQLSEVTAVQPFQFTRLAVRLLLLAQGGQLACAPLAPSKVNGDWSHKAEGGRVGGELEIFPEPVYLETRQRDELARSLKLPGELLDMAARLLETGGLWAPRAPHKVSDRLRAWLQLSPQEQSRRLFAAAAGLPSQVELDLARPAGFTAWRSAQSTISYDEFRTGLGAARMRLVRLLARAPLGQWLDIDSILRMLHGLQPGWVMEYQSRQEGRNSERFWNQIPQWAAIGKHKINPLDYEDWKKAYGQFYLVMLTRTLPWLGLVDVGWKDGRAAAVRLAAFGEFLIGRSADFPLPAVVSAHPALALRPNGLLELDLDAAPLELVNLLLQIAMPEASAREGQLVYRVYELGVGQAYESGMTLDQITARLQAALGSQAPLPDDLSRRLRLVWEHYGRLQIYEDMALIELEDDFALPELLAGTRLSQILVYTFSPRLVAVRSAEVNEFVAQLQARGFTPRIEGSQHG